MIAKSSDQGQTFQRVHNIKVNLHRLCTLPQRPSSLFGWDDPDDWYARLMFDLEIINNTWEEVNSN